MTKRTFGEVKAQLAKVASRTGLAATDSRVMEYYNRACEELWHAGDWPGIVDRYSFWAYDGTIVLPGDLETALAAILDNQHVQMTGPWFEFYQHGSGPQSPSAESAYLVLIPRDEWPVWREIPNEDGETYYLRIRTDVAETGTVTLQGYDSNGKWIQTLDGTTTVEGEKLDLSRAAIDGYVQTVNTFQQVTGVQFSAARKRFVSLYAYDGTEEYGIGYYAPKEITPSYRVYYLPGITSGTPTQVIVRARKRFIPITADADVLPISNIPAIESMTLGLAAKEAGELGKYNDYRELALRSLREESRSYRGKDRGPCIRVPRGMGFGSEL